MSECFLNRACLQKFLPRQPVCLQNQISQALRVRAEQEVKDGQENSSRLRFWTELRNANDQHKLQQSVAAVAPRKWCAQGAGLCCILMLPTTTSKFCLTIQSSLLQSQCVLQTHVKVILIIFLSLFAWYYVVCY